MSIHILGIRHHGPGSSRNVRAFLEEKKPDIILVEGPPDADPLLEWASHKELKPPIALLCYRPDDPQCSVFYPFAEFSPEWQAIKFAKENHIPVRFIDLPCAISFAMEKEEKELKQKEKEKEQGEEDISGSVRLNDPAAMENAVEEIRTDPISFLAEAAGFEEGEKWWEQMFEFRHHTEEVFEAVGEAMQALRSELKLKEDRREKLREAHMRKMIRQAEREMYTEIAVVCGAWHVPALMDMPKQKEDNELLKGLPKLKVECTWIPWTYDRLSYFSGYGAGIGSPGWYEHIWEHPRDDGTMWMSKVARLFRKNGMDTSVAHVIEAVRLAETLASLRGFSKAGLEELNEATLSVLCNGEPMMLELIGRALIVSNRIGQVPLEIPKPPLQMDIEKSQRSLRLPPTADLEDYVLDLRKDLDLSRSIFLHRLRLLEIPWGQPAAVTGKGTFKEQWRLQWNPEFTVTIIEKGSWGNSVEEAANNFLVHQAAGAASLLQVSQLLQEVLPAELHRAVEALIRQVDQLSASSGDVVQLMQSVPPLAQVTRYGNVRKTDTELVLDILVSMVTRICISLPNAVVGIDEEASANLLEMIRPVHDAISLLQDDGLNEQWKQTISLIAHNHQASALISGYATRLSMDQGLLQGEEMNRLFRFRLSPANLPAWSASWLEGFLKGSGTLLLLDENLWELVNAWVDQLQPEDFEQLLPLLRRTFSGFTPSERRKLGEQLKTGRSSRSLVQESDIDHQRAIKGLPIVLQLLGHKKKEN